MDACSSCGQGENGLKILSRNMKERNDFGVLDVDGRIILKSILKKSGM
jgi:hypothetical protein